MSPSQQASPTMRQKLEVRILTLGPRRFVWQLLKNGTKIIQHGNASSFAEARAMADKAQSELKESHQTQKWTSAKPANMRDRS